MNIKKEELVSYTFFNKMISKDKTVLGIQKINSNDKPLLVYSIEHAKQSKYDMRIIVSTDSIEYAKIANKYGAETPFLRPLEISQDNSLDLDCMRHTLERTGMVMVLQS